MSDITTNNEPASQVNLQLTDLVSVLEILQVASSRGAFRPDEFSAIGGVYERIFTFLESTGAVKKPASKSAAEPAPPITEGNQS